MGGDAVSDARGLFLGQPGTITVCLHLIALWAIWKKQDILAGVLLALSIYKPQIGFLIIPFLLLWALRVYRWRIVISFGVTAGALILLSFLFVPSWLGDWLQQAAQYTGYTRIGSPVWVVTHVYLPFLGDAGELLIGALLVLFMLWAWWRVIGRNEQALFAWTAALTLAVTHLIAVRTATPHFVAYLPVLVLTMRQIARTDRRTGSLRAAAVMVALSAALWVLFLTTLEGRFEHPANYLPLPFGSLILLSLLRRDWWRLPIPTSPAS
ncbi:MAG: glycosyltransferase family 87 protein [Anaerolineae bacterium]